MSIVFDDEQSETQPSDRATPVKAGRPTREQTRARHAALLDRALDHFLERGYEGATIEAIATDVSMTKRTVYARYPDKAALFLAAVRRGIDRYAASSAQIAAARADDFERTLLNIARLRVELSRTVHGLKLQRVINTESYRFPEIFTTFYDVATRPVVRFLVEAMEEEARAGRLAIDDPDMAAIVFLSMVVSGPIRIIISGNALSENDLEARLTFAVRLFLQGALPRNEIDEERTR